MPSVLSKNCVTKGIIDFYCLVCSKHFIYETEALIHLNENKHKTAIRAINYLEDFKNDCIKKIKSLYYCEVCDVTFPTITKVKLHISEDHHKKQKEDNLIQRVDKKVVAVKNTLISNDAWNGILDDTCLICNVEFETETVHISQESHILNMIQSKVVFDEDFIHRKTDNTLHQCLTCNQLVTEDGLLEHANTTEHKNSLNSTQNKDTVNTTNINKKTSKNENNNKNESNLVDLIDIYREQKINLNLIANTAVCKICSKNIEFKKEAIDEHIKQHYPDKNENEKKNTVPDTKVDKQTSSKTEAMQENINKTPLHEENDEIARKHGLIQCKDRFYCKACNCFTSLTKLKKHIISNKHATKTSDLTKRPEVLNKDSKVLFKEMIHTNNCATTHTDEGEFIVLQEKYTVLLSNFLCLGTFRDKFICFVCDIDLKDETDIPKHIMNERHGYYIEHSHFITAIEGEFIREITQERYHCGHCAITTADWEDMLVHLTTDEHYHEKMKAQLAFVKFKKHIAIETHLKNCFEVFRYSQQFF